MKRGREYKPVYVLSSTKERKRIQTILCLFRQYKLLVLQVYDRADSQTAKDFLLNHVLKEFHFKNNQIQVDSGIKFWAILNKLVKIIILLCLFCLKETINLMAVSKELIDLFNKNIIYNLFFFIIKPIVLADIVLSPSFLQNSSKNIFILYFPNL